MKKFAKKLQFRCFDLFVIAALFNCNFNNNIWKIEEKKQEQKTNNWNQIIQVDLNWIQLNSGQAWQTDVITTYTILSICPIPVPEYEFTPKTPTQRQHQLMVMVIIFLIVVVAVMLVGIHFIAFNYKTINRHFMALKHSQSIQK